MVLNLHGECPNDHAKNITVLNAEVCSRGAPFFQFGGVSKGVFLETHLLSRQVSGAATLNAPS
jgi:hypothetical protein